MSRKVDVRLPGKENSNSHGARPVHLIITMIKWIRTSRLSIKNFLSGGTDMGEAVKEERQLLGERVPHRHISLSRRMYLLISFRKSTPPQNRQLIVHYY